MGSHESSDKIDFYKTLGTNKRASQNDIKQAYYKLSLIHHPDRGDSSNKFQEIALAYKVLSDPLDRKIYNAEGLKGLKMKDYLEKLGGEYGSYVVTPLLKWVYK